MNPHLHILVKQFLSKPTFFGLLLSLLCFTQVNAQTIIGRQKVDQYATSPYSTSTYGLTWLPTDYSYTTQQYPLIIFLHGSGEGGDGAGGLYNLASQGLPMTIANGFNPEAVNPKDGKNYKFIVVSPQAPWSMRWSYGYNVIQYILADVIKKYRIDPTRIYVTGLSAGGSGTYSCVTNGAEFAKKFAAVVPVCPAGSNSPSEFDQLKYVSGTYGVKVWSPVGAQDALYTYSQLAVNTINSGSPAPLIPAVISGIPNVGHEPAGWNTAYNPSWRSNSQNQNIYEWMLKYTRTNEDDDNEDDDEIKVNQPPVVHAGDDKGITLPVSYINLNGSATDEDGSIISYLWSQISGPSTATFNNRSIVNPFVTNLSTGSYTFRLTAKDNSYATSFDDVVINVTAAHVTSITIPGRIEAENFSGMYGIQTEYTADAGGGQNVAWQDDNDWMDYTVNVSSSGTYTFNFRVASMFSGAQFQLRKSDGSVLATLTVPNTGHFQSWQTVSASVNLPAGHQTLRVVTTQANGGWNFNFIDVTVSTNSTPTSSQKIEAENYSGMYGIQTEYTADAGGGQNVGWQDNNDWMDYSVNTAAAGTYTVNFRVASMFSGAQFQLRKSDGSVLATITVPNTGNFQSWQTVSASVYLPAGQQTLRVVTTQANGGWNFNWMEIKNGAPNSRIEAEQYKNMFGIQTENTSDEGGGQNVGWQDNNDWMDYAVNVSSSGTYTFNFRVASMFTGAQFQLRKSDGSVLATINVPNTGNFQSWQTVSASVNIPAGQQTLRVVTTQANGGWNLNWLDIEEKNEQSYQTVRIQSIAENQNTVNKPLNIYPNPVNDYLVLEFSNDYKGAMILQVINMNGSVLRQVQLTKPAAGLTQTRLSINGLAKGTYLVKIIAGKWNETRKITKL